MFGISLEGGYDDDEPPTLPPPSGLAATAVTAAAIAKNVCTSAWAVPQAEASCSALLYSALLNLGGTASRGCRLQECVLTLLARSFAPAFIPSPAPSTLPPSFPPSALPPSFRPPSLLSPFLPPSVPLRALVRSSTRCQICPGCTSRDAPRCKPRQTSRSICCAAMPGLNGIGIL